LSSQPGFVIRGWAHDPKTSSNELKNHSTFTNSSHKHTVSIYILGRGQARGVTSVLRPLFIQLQQQPRGAHAACFQIHPNSPTLASRGTLLRDSSRLSLHPPAGAMGSVGSGAEVTRADFPDGFVFGVATSAYQVPTPSSPPPGRRTRITSLCLTALDCWWTVVP
jgi:hypothetical protein